MERAHSLHPQGAGLYRQKNHPWSLIGQNTDTLIGQNRAAAIGWSCAAPLGWGESVLLVDAGLQELLYKAGSAGRNTVQAGDRRGLSKLQTVWEASVQKWLLLFIY